MVWDEKVGFSGVMLWCSLLVGTIQRPVAGWHLPSSISSALQNTLHEFFVKMTLHPLSHSCLTESSKE